MADNFLSEDNLCGQTLLRLVSRGSAVLAELQRLAENIPPVFTDTSSKNDYAPVLHDFSYLKDEDKIEKVIQNQQRLLNLDEEFKDNYWGILERFFSLFEAIYKYVVDFQTLLVHIEEGVFVQQTYESILVSIDGKQLMAESLYLYGAMLLLLDQKIDGEVRERMLISYLRYKGAGSVQNFDEVCKLCRSTGYSLRNGKTPGQHPAGYPEDFFARITIDPNVIMMITGRLRSDDIYGMAFNYPSPEHRSTALSSQAAMLYVLLYFQPQLLKTQQATMREIVDKHFPDNWVINWYMGYTVDLNIVWAPYKAAIKAIENTVTSENVRGLTTHFAAKLTTLNIEVADLLREGFLTENYVLDNINAKLLPVVRDCNVTLRWWILHRTCNVKKIRDIILQGTNQDEILKLLLSTAQLEFLLKDMFRVLLKHKKRRWNAAKEAGVTKMTAISEYFAGGQVLTSEKKEVQLQAYFAERAETIGELDHRDSTLAGRKIITLITALEEVEQFHQVFENLQVRQFLMDTRTLLKRMLRYVNIKEKVPITIATVGDLSYGWELISTFVEGMQQRIKKMPSLVIQLRSTFLKLSTMLELPLTRIAQAGSPDLASVSQYYSESLVAFVRKVLDIIPISMFEVLTSIIHMQTNQLKECPARLNRADLHEYAQLDARYELSKATYQVSKFTEGILAMKKTLVGVIQIDPHQMLEEGIRKEVVQQISQILHSHLRFRSAKEGEPLGLRLAILGTRLNGMRSSFEYIQDYMDVYGLRIWQEEFSRTINYNVEQECNEFIKRKVFDWDSRYQSTRIPIPRFDRLDESVNFMGRLVRELQNQTDSKKTVYVDQLASWYNSGGKEVVGLRTFSLIRESMGVFGLSGMDKLLCFMTVREIQLLMSYIDKLLSVPTMVSELDRMSKEINPPDTLPKDSKKWYEGLTAKLQKSHFALLLDVILRIGRNQLLRRHVANELRFCCKLDSNMLFQALSVFNQSLLADIHYHYSQPDDYPYPDKENPILSELNNYLEAAGLTHTFSKVYTTITEQIQHIPLLLFLFVIAQLPRFTFDVAIDSLVSKKKDDGIDGIPFVVGVATLLKQLHSEHKECFVSYLAQYVRVVMNEVQWKEKREVESIPLEVVNCLHFLEAFCKLAPLPRRIIENEIPPHLFSRFKGDSDKKGKK